MLNVMTRGQYSADADRRRREEMLEQAIPDLLSIHPPHDLELLSDLAADIEHFNADVDAYNSTTLSPGDVPEDDGAEMDAKAAAKFRDKVFAMRWNFYFLRADLHRRRGELLRRIGEVVSEITKVIEEGRQQRIKALGEVAGLSANSESFVDLQRGLAKTDEEINAANWDRWVSRRSNWPPDCDKAAEISELHFAEFRKRLFA